MKTKAVHGIAWSAVEKFSVQGVQFVVSIILARLLTPSDFAPVVITLVFLIVFQTINESGVSVALVHKQGRDNLDYSVAFITNLLIGVSSYVLIFCLAPLIAEFYGDGTLVLVMRILALTLIIQAFGIVPLAICTIRIDFQTQARASFVASIISGIVGLLVAYSFRNVYALVVQQLIYCFVNVIFIWRFVSIKFPLVFDKARFIYLFSYASRLIGARVISAIFDELYALAIGKLYAPALLGCYNRAMSLRQFFSRNIINVVQRVSFPILCESQNDYPRMRMTLVKFMSLTALVVFPMLTGLMILSEPLVRAVLGEQWQGVVKVLLYVCPCGFFYLISTFNRNVYSATGRTDLALRSEVLKKLLFVIIFLFTIHSQIEALLIGLILISFLEMLVDMFIVKRLIGLGFWAEIRSLVGIVWASLFMSLVVYNAIELVANPWLQLLAGASSGLVVYSLICFIFNVANVRTEILSYAGKKVK